jgi:hypothetical protein
VGLAPAPIVFVLFMGMQDRFFGRWLLPVFPMMCLLAAFAAIDLADRAARWKPALRPTFLAIAAVALCAQGVVYSLHIGQVLSREDTRNLTRAWMVEHLPPRTKIVIEPIAPDALAQDIGNPSRLTVDRQPLDQVPDQPLAHRRREPRRPAAAAARRDHRHRGLRAHARARPRRRVRREELLLGHRRLDAARPRRGRRRGRCRRRSAYYRKLERSSRLAYEASPYKRGQGPVEFNFDFTFNQYPKDYYRRVR